MVRRRYWLKKKVPGKKDPKIEEIKPDPDIKKPIVVIDYDLKFERA